MSGTPTPVAAKALEPEEANAATPVPATASVDHEGTPPNVAKLKLKPIEGISFFSPTPPKPVDRKRTPTRSTLTPLVDERNSQAESTSGQPTVPGENVGAKESNKSSGENKETTPAPFSSVSSETNVTGPGEAQKKVPHILGAAPIVEQSQSVPKNMFPDSI